MSKISATRLGKPYGLSYQKVHKILAEYGLYDIAAHQPTPRAIAEDFVERKIGKSPIFDRKVEYFAWDDQKTISFFTVPTQLELARFNLTHSNALDRMCARFSDFGQILGIELRSPNLGISEAANKAVVQSYFGDLECARGTVLWHRLFTKSEVDSVYKNTMELATELYAAAIKKNRKKFAGRAQLNLDVIECVLDRL